MQAGQPRGRVAQAIESLVLVENHLSDLERHSTAQVNQLQQEQEVLASAADYADQGPADLPAAFENLLGFQKDVKTLQKDFYRMQKEHDSFVKETYDMFEQSSAIICDAVRELLGKR